MTDRNQPIEPEGRAVGLEEICVILELKSEVVTEWVAEGIVRPEDRRADEWRFSAGELERKIEKALSKGAAPSTTAASGGRRAF